MATIEQLPGNATPPENSPPEPRYSLRGPRHGDFGWIVKRHAELYAQEYGRVGPFEGVCAKIVADFVNTFDDKRERRWIAEIDGENVGSIMLARRYSETVARIRLLLVDPKARGLGLGRHLTDECIRFARDAGYRKMTRWTHTRSPPRATSISAPVSSDALGTTRKLGPPGGQRALGFGVLTSTVPAMAAVTP